MVLLNRDLNLQKLNAELLRMESLAKTLITLENIDLSKIPKEIINDRNFQSRELTEKINLEMAFMDKTIDKLSSLLTRWITEARVDIKAVEERIKRQLQRLREE